MSHASSSNSPSSSSGSSDPAGIERELDRTRSRLGSHLSELQERLSPGQVLDDVMGYLRGGETSDFARNLLDNVRANPMPAAITGIGLAWLMASGPRAASSAPAPQDSRVHDHRRLHASAAPGPGYGEGGYDAMVSRVRSAEQGVSRGAGEDEQSYMDRLAAARGQAVGLARHAQETTESFGHRILDALRSAEQSVLERGHDLRDQVGGVAGAAAAGARNAAQSVGSRVAQGGAQAGHSTLNAGSQVAAAITGSPVLLGALGLAAGALLGALLPQSEKEQEALGDIADQARGAARDLAQEAVDRGGRVATAVMQSGQEAAQAHGLTSAESPGGLVDSAASGELAGKARRVVEEVVRSGDTAVREEVLADKTTEKSQAGS